MSLKDGKKGVKMCHYLKVDTGFILIRLFQLELEVIILVPVNWGI